MIFLINLDSGEGFKTNKFAFERIVTLSIKALYPAQFAAYQAKQEFGQLYEFDRNDYKRILRAPIGYLLKVSWTDGRLSTYECKRVLSDLNKIKAFNDSYAWEDLQQLKRVLQHAVEQKGEAIFI